MAEHPDGEGNRFVGYRHMPDDRRAAAGTHPERPEAKRQGFACRGRVGRGTGDTAARTANRSQGTTAGRTPVDGGGCDPGPVSAEARRVEDALRNPRASEPAPKVPLEGMFRDFEAARRGEIARAAKKTLSVLKEQVYLPWRNRLGYIEVASARVLHMAASRLQMAKRISGPAHGSNASARPRDSAATFAATTDRRGDRRTETIPARTGNREFSIQRP